MMLAYDDKCQLDPTMPLKYPCIRYNIHLATPVIISLCRVMMSQSGDITNRNKVISGGISIESNVMFVDKKNVQKRRTDLRRQI
jgi:hypothetical protein